MKPRLIVLSDLWGIPKSKWMKQYTEVLKATFDVVVYDSLDLGQIDRSIDKESEIHKQFVVQGIDIASNELLANEPEKVSVLAFSVGGTIAWKAALLGMKVDCLYAVSATRLRYEIVKPDAYIQLYYGEEDNYKPDHNWFATIQIEKNIFDKKGHMMYTEIDFINMLSRKITEDQHATTKKN